MALLDSRAALDAEDEAGMWRPQEHCLLFERAHLLS